MTTGTVALGSKSTFAVMAHAAKFAGIDVIHGDLNRPLLHLWKHLLVVAILALVASVLMQCAIKGDHSHGAVVELDRFLARNSQDDA